MRCESRHSRRNLPTVRTRLDERTRRQRRSLCVRILMSGRAVSAMMRSNQTYLRKASGEGRTGFRYRRRNDAESTAFCGRARGSFLGAKLPPDMASRSSPRYRAAVQIGRVARGRAAGILDHLRQPAVLGCDVVATASSRSTGSLKLTAHRDVPPLNDRRRRPVRPLERRRSSRSIRTISFRCQWEDGVRPAGRYRPDAQDSSLLLDCQSTKL